jgi:transcriptional regulator with XRE-family HTH domain
MQRHAARDHQPQAPDFRGLLQQELARRCSANPNYSLRSFARSLAVEPSALSQILSGKRPLTEKMKLRLGAALGLSVEALKRLPASDRTAPGFQQLTLDAFAVVSDWYHYAILELLFLEDFQANASWISRRLKITKSEANMAIERLFRLGLLERAEDGSWADTSQNNRLTHLVPGVSSDAARKYQSQLLELSKGAVQEIPIDKRNHTSATFCFDPEDLPKATERIREFRRKFANDFQPKKKAKEVYQIQISFFPLTHSIEKKEKRK